eukprot:GHVR01143036.1.p1 GENE.GHVR01143036.1~~GHVR01143036.1.p1  ORF type:complete len:672 (+),score=84.60 GHVR01143036.1:228-2243(+)
MVLGHWMKCVRKPCCCHWQQVLCFLLFVVSLGAFITMLVLTCVFGHIRYSQATFDRDASVYVLLGSTKLEGKGPCAADIGLFVLQGKALMVLKSGLSANRNVFDVLVDPLSRLPFVLTFWFKQPCGVDDVAKSIFSGNIGKLPVLAPLYKEVEAMANNLGGIKKKEFISFSTHEHLTILMESSRQRYLRVVDSFDPSEDARVVTRAKPSGSSGVEYYECGLQCKCDAHVSQGQLRDSNWREGVCVSHAGLKLLSSYVGPEGILDKDHLSKHLKELLELPPPKEDAKGLSKLPKKDQNNSDKNTPNDVDKHMKGDNDDTDNKNDDTGNKNDDTDNKNDGKGKILNEKKNNNEEEKNNENMRECGMLYVGKYAPDILPVLNDVAYRLNRHLQPPHGGPHQRPILSERVEPTINARLFVDFGLLEPLKNNGGGVSRPELRPFTMFVNIYFGHLFLPLADYDVGEFSMGVYVDSRDVNWCGASGLAVSDSEFFPRCVIELGGGVAVKFVNTEASTPKKLAVGFTKLLSIAIKDVRNKTKKEQKLFHKKEKASVIEVGEVIMKLCNKDHYPAYYNIFSLTQPKWCEFMVHPSNYGETFVFSVNGYLYSDFKLVHSPTPAFRVALLHMILGARSSIKNTNYKLDPMNYRKYQDSVSKYEEMTFNPVNTRSIDQFLQI